MIYRHAEYYCKYVRSGTLLYIPVCTKYCTKKLLLGGARMVYRHAVGTVLLYCKCVRSGTLLFIPVCTKYCTKKLLLGGAQMIYRDTVCTKCVPSGFSTVMWQGLERCLLWCRVESRLLSNADHGIMVHSNLSAGPFPMLLEGTSNKHVRSMHTILSSP